MRDFVEDKDGYLNFYDACPICGRAYDQTMSRHHLTPKCKKGRETVDLHRVCHDKIHSLFTDKELANDYNTIEKLMADDRMQTFGGWCSKRPPNFTDPSTMSNRKNKNKRK